MVSSKYCYPKPTPPNIQVEDGPAYQLSQFSVRNIYEWKIDGKSL